jgi:hypothetical protein
MMKLWSFIFLFCIPLFGYAGTGSGQVEHIMVHTGDVIMFSVEEHLDKPSCSTQAHHWALSLSTETGKAMYALLLSAAAQGQEVVITGDGECNAWGDRESPAYMHIVY